MQHPPSMTPTLSVDPEYEWARQHAAEVDDVSEPAAAWAAVIAEHGSVGVWLASCAKRRAADTEIRLARIIMKLVTEAPGRPRGTLRSPERELLLMLDPELAAYWWSVVRGGDVGWEEESQVRLLGGRAVAALLPTWREFGQMLIDAGEAEGLDEAFMVPE